jgi:hypothetical protein
MSLLLLALEKLDRLFIKVHEKNVPKKRSGDEFCK